MVAYREQDTGVEERYYLVADHLGTNSHQIKYSDGTRESQYYLPFGGDRGGTAGNFNTDRGYTGQVSDAAHTGLLFYNARYYDPKLRRFISADTIIPDPGNPQDLNRYTYVRNNPVRYNDPTGHCWWLPGSGDSGCPGADFVRAHWDEIALGLGCAVVTAATWGTTGHCFGLMAVYVAGNTVKDYGDLSAEGELTLANAAKTLLGNAGTAIGIWYLAGLSGGTSFPDLLPTLRSDSLPKALRKPGYSRSSPERYSQLSILHWRRDTISLRSQMTCYSSSLSSTARCTT